MSMNHLCGCGVSASKLELQRQRDISNSCKICGGKPLVDGQGALPGSMLSNIGLEISAVIDPHLNWRTASKGKPRAVRRARTSFTSIIKRKPLEKAPEMNKDLINKESKKSREMPVSESEKLGVTILGQRFSDTIESVPIKKRRFLFRSPSPPPHPLLGDESAHSSVSRDFSHHRGTAPSLSEQPLKMNNAYKSGLVDRTVTDKKTNSDYIGERLCDAADFSGISILAAAACNSSSVDDDVNTEGCSFKRDESFGMFESQSRCENKITEGQVPDSLPVLDDKANTTLVSTSKVSCRGEDTAKTGGSSLDEVSSCSLSDRLKANGSFGGTGSMRDGRFHWDLNTVMEAWESPEDDVIIDSQPVNSNPIGEDGTPRRRVDEQEPSEGNVVEDSFKSVEKIVDMAMDSGGLLLCNYESENPVGSVSPCNASADDGNHLVQQHQLVCAPVQMTELVEETNVLNNQRPSGLTKGVECSGLDDPTWNSPSANSNVSDDEKANANGLGVYSAMETETRASLHLNGSASTEHLTCVSEPNSAVDKRSNEIVSSEEAFVGFVVDIGKCSNDCGSADCQNNEAVQAGETVFSCPHQDDSKLNDCYDGPGADLVSDIPAADEGSSGDGGQIEPFNGEKSDIIRQPTGAGNGTCPSETFTSVLHGLYNHEDNSGGCMTKDERENSGNARLEGRWTVLTVHDGDSMELDEHIRIESKDSMAPNCVDGCLVTHIPSDKDKGYKGNLVNSHVENALDDHFDCDYYSDASQSEQAIGMEMVEQQGDDESQYEDGEFRETFVHSWEMYGCDEGEAEHVDYGSDNREFDGFEAASDYPAPSIPSHIGSFEGSNEGLHEDSHAEDHNVDMANAKPGDFPLSVSNVSDITTTKKESAGSVKNGPNISHSGRKYICKKWEKSTKDAAESGPPTDKVAEDTKDVAEGDGSRERSRSASLRMKSSGWDRLPGGHRSSGVTVADSLVDGNDMKCDSVPEKLKTVGSTLRRELPSRIGRPKSPDILHKKDRAYFRGARNRDDTDDTNHDVKRDIEWRSVRRDDSSVHVHCRGRGDHWMESSTHQGPGRHDSTGYYGRAGFTHPGSKSAAAVSIAKVESNGFVVAPDGTVLEASGVGHSGRLPRRSGNSSPNARRTLRRRGSPIERDETLPFNESQLDIGPRRDLSPGRHISIGHGRPSRYGPKMISEGNTERYHGFTADGNIGSSLPVNHSFSRGDRSFSPQTRPVQVSRSHTRSHSRSRSRSPHIWTSPRRSNLMNNGFRRRTRSPTEFRSDAKVGRVRSPQGRSGFAEHATGFVQSGRNRGSPLRAPRWVDERKDFIEHFRDHEYRRFSGRSPPKRLFSRSHRLNPVDSSGRLKPDEFYRPMHSGRFAEFSMGRAPRPEDGDGERRHMDRYEMLPSARRYDIVGDIKRSGYETEDDFRLHNNRSKNAPDFPERGSPRSFDRVVTSQLNNSPLRAKEEMSHFRYGRDGKHKTNYKTFEIRECDEDGTPRRRRHS